MPSILILHVSQCGTSQSTNARYCRKYEGNVGEEYDAWTQEGILEHYWGEHIHLGYYNDAERKAGYKRKDFKARLLHMQCCCRDSADLCSLCVIADEVSAVVSFL